MAQYHEDLLKKVDQHNNRFNEATTFEYRSTVYENENNVNSRDIRGTNEIQSIADVEEVKAREEAVGSVSPQTQEVNTIWEKISPKINTAAGALVQASTDAQHSILNPYVGVKKVQNALTVAKGETPDADNAYMKVQNAVEDKQDIIASEFISGVTGGIIEPTVDDEEKRTLDEKVLGTAGNIGGMVVGIGKFRVAISGMLKSASFLTKTIAKHPTLYRATLEGGAFAGYGQLDPRLGWDLGERAKHLGGDAVLGSVLGVTSKVPGLKGYIAGGGAGVGLGFGLSKLDGASNEEAMKNGLVFGILDVAIRGAGGIAPSVARKYLDMEAKNKIKSGATGKEKAYAEQILKTEGKAKTAVKKDQQKELAAHVRGEKTADGYSGDVIKAKKIEGIKAETQDDFEKQVREITKGSESEKIVDASFKGSREGYAGSINLNKYSEKEQTQIIASAERMKYENNLNKGKLTDDEILQRSEEMYVMNKTPGKIISKEQTLAEAAEMQRSKVVLDNAAKKMNKLGKDSSEKEVSTAVKAIDAALGTFDSMSAHAGRLLRSLKIGRKKQVATGDEEVMDRIMTKVVGGFEKGSAERKKVLEEWAKIDKKNGNEVVTFYRKYVKPTGEEYFQQYRYSAMLSNPRSHLRNALWGIWQTGISNPIEMFGSTAIKEKGLTKSAGEVGKYYKGVFGAFGKASKDVKDFMTGKKIFSGVKGETVIIPTSASGWNKTLTIGPRLMEAGDRFFNRLIREGEKSAKGVSEEKAFATAERLLGRAQFNSSKASGQGPISRGADAIGEGLEAWRKSDSRTLRWSGNLALPFLRTPMQIGKLMMENSPAGFANLYGASSEFKRSQIVKATVGSMVSAGVGTMIDENRLAYKPPTDPKLKEQWYASGRKPMSVRIGDKWIPMTMFGPYAFAMAIPAIADYQLNEDPNRLIQGEQGNKKGGLQKEDWKALAQSGNVGEMMVQLSSAFLQLTPLQSLKSASDLLGDDPRKIRKYGISLAGQFVPALEKYIATIFDPTLRHSQDAKDEIKKMFIEFSKQVQPYMSPSEMSHYTKEQQRVMRKVLDADELMRMEKDQPVQRNMSDYALPYSVGEHSTVIEETMMEALEKQAGRRVLLDTEKKAKREKKEEAYKEEGWME